MIEKISLDPFFRILQFRAEYRKAANIRFVKQFAKTHLVPTFFNFIPTRENGMAHSWEEFLMTSPFIPEGKIFFIDAPKKDNE